MTKIGWEWCGCGAVITIMHVFICIVSVFTAVVNVSISIVGAFLSIDVIDSISYYYHYHLPDYHPTSSTSPSSLISPPIT